MNYLKIIYSSVAICLLAVVVCGILYPLAIMLVSGIAFPWQAGGSPVTENGSVIGSVLIGQNFTGPGYFYSRPSAVDYNASSSGASNLGPDNIVLLAQVESRMPTNASVVPADAVLGSGSGLDPDISIDNAMIQVPRVAAESGISEAAVMELVQKHEQGRFLWIWGEPRVNVLELNIALKDLKENRTS